jgi:heat shock protein HtpX
MGLGGRRVMGLGLPLMQLLKVAEFRGVLAHEFGHYHGGDTKLGPWVYKTRGAIGRTFENLAQHSSLLQVPFIGYGNLFLRLTHAVSRRQEFTADELAASVVGARPMITGLQTVHTAGMVFQPFWQQECVPVLSAGFRPSVTEGFTRFLNAGQIAAAVSKALTEEMAAAPADPYDTHPPLRERIAALEQLPAGEPEADGPLAVTLLVDVADLEKQLLVTLAGADTVAKLQPVNWDQVGEQVFLPQWRELAKKHTRALTGVTAADLPAHAQSLADFAKRFKPTAEPYASEDDLRAVASGTLGAAIALALHARAHPLECEPGAPVAFQCGQQRIEPFSALEQLASGKLTADDWRQRCAAFGISDVDLGSLCA